MVGIYRLSVLLVRLLSLCTAVMSRLLTPRPGVSHAPAAEYSRHFQGMADIRIGPACRHACRFFVVQIRNAPYLPGTIVHNTRAVAALQTRPGGPNRRSAPSSSPSALRASAHLCRTLFAQALITAPCRPPASAPCR